MSENKPFASRYIETGAGTALAFTAVVRAVVAVIAFTMAASVPASESWLIGLAARSAQSSTAITMILNVLMAVGLILMRYKRKGDGMVYLVLILEMISAVIAAIPVILSGSFVMDSSMPEPLRKNYVLAILLAGSLLVATVGYLCACLKLLAVVRMELKHTEPVTSKFRNAVPIFCLIIIFTTIAEAVYSYAASGSLINMATTLLSVVTYGSLYTVAKKFDQEHKELS